MSLRVMLLVLVSMELLAQCEAAPKQFGFMTISLPVQGGDPDDFRARRSISQQHNLADLIDQYEAVPTRFGYMSPFLSGFPGRNVADPSHQEINNMIMNQKARRTRRSSICRYKNLGTVMKWPGRWSQSPFSSFCHFTDAHDEKFYYG